MRYLIWFVQLCISIPVAAQQFPADTTAWEISYLDMNSGYDEFGPAVFNRGLLFVSNRGRTTAFSLRDNKDSLPFLTLYYVYSTATLKGTPAPEWKTNNPQRPALKAGSSNDSRKVAAMRGPAPLPRNVAMRTGDDVMLFNQQINDRLHDGPVSFNKRQDTMYITRNDTKQGKAAVSKLKIYTLIYRYGNWVNAGGFPYNNKDHSVGHPALHPDGNILYFVSDMPGGLGGTDIYYSLKTDSGWAAPQNAGPAVNSAGNEMFPYISPAGELFYSSDGKGGAGGLDLFRAPLVNYLPGEGGRNLGAPFNSPQDDFSCWVNEDGRSGYFSSNRYGTDDVFQFKQKM